MLIFRLTAGALTLPEVLIDWVTSVVPLELFSLAIAALGEWAKRLLVAGLAIVLVLAGGGGGMLWDWLQRRWLWPGFRGKWLLAGVFGLCLWLVMVAVALPLSGRGVFAARLSPWPLALVLGWLFSSLAYAFLLAGLYSSLAQDRVFRGVTDLSRRSFIKRLAFASIGLTAAERAAEPCLPDRSS